MKILQVIDQLWLGGAERVCVNMVNLLKRNNYDVKLVVFNQSGVLFDLVDKDVEIVVLETKKNRFKAYKRLIKEVKEADIVHIHMRQNYKYVKKTLLAYGLKKKLILHDHYGEIAVNKRIPTFYRSFYKPDIYIGCSKLLTDWALERVKLTKEDVFLVNNFVLRYELEKINKNVKREGLVLVGNLKPVKNHILAIQIAQKLGKEITIYCTQSNSSYFLNLKKQIEELGYTGSVHFVYNCTNIQLELFQYELALLTSISEGDPLVLIEYAAQGIPFLCSNVGESVKVLKKHFPSFVQDDYNIENWITNYSKAIKVASQDIQKVYDEHFSSDIFLKRYIDIYTYMLESKLV